MNDSDLFVQLIENPDPCIFFAAAFLLVFRSYRQLVHGLIRNQRSQRRDKKSDHS